MKPITIEIVLFEKYNNKVPMWYAECSRLNLWAWGGTKRTALITMANKMKTIKKEVLEELK